MTAKVNDKSKYTTNNNIGNNSNPFQMVTLE